MSTRLQIRNALKRRVPRADLTDTDYDKWIDDGMLDLCTARVHLRSLEAVGTNVVTTIGITSYVIQTDFFSIMFIEDSTNHRVLTRFNGGFREFLDSKQVAPSGQPTRFVEFGPNFYVLDVPAGLYTLVPYGYKRPSFSVAGDSGVPNIEPEWHYPIELIAAQHAWRDLGDEERAASAESEFQAWVAKRDTPTRASARYNIPQVRTRPHPSLHNPRTGV